MNQYRTLFLSLLIMLSLSATADQSHISWLPYGKEGKASVTVEQKTISPTLSIASREQIGRAHV